MFYIILYILYESMTHIIQVERGENERETGRVKGKEGEIYTVVESHRAGVVVRGRQRGRDGKGTG